MLRSESPSTFPLSPEERALILTLRSNKATDVVTAGPVYVELLQCCGRDVAEALLYLTTPRPDVTHSMGPLTRANNLLAYLNSHTVVQTPTK